MSGSVLQWPKTSPTPAPRNNNAHQSPPSGPPRWQVLEILPEFPDGSQNASLGIVRLEIVSGQLAFQTRLQYTDARPNQKWAPDSFQVKLERVSTRTGDAP